jgi:hypothetical protein
VAKTEAKYTVCGSCDNTKRSGARHTKGLDCTLSNNFDESGFPIGVTTDEQVIVPVDCQVVYQVDPANRELVTTVETLNYGGKKVLSMIVFAGAYHPIWIVTFYSLVPQQDIAMTSLD